MLVTCASTGEPQTANVRIAKKAIRGDKAVIEHLRVFMSFCWSCEVNFFFMVFLLGFWSLSSLTNSVLPEGEDACRDFFTFLTVLVFGRKQTPSFIP